MSQKCITATKEFFQKHGKKLAGLAVAVVLVATLAAGARAMFRVDGVVTGVDNNSVTVASFFRSQTVDLTGAPVNIAGVKPGDRIMIQKNIQGNVLYARIFEPGHKPAFRPHSYRDSSDLREGSHHEGSRR